MKEHNSTNFPREAWVTHVAPFIAWIFLMHLLGDPEGWKYAARSILCLGLFVLLRPWRWYGPLRLKNIIPALLLGAFVFLFWIIGESAWAGRFPNVQKLYLTVGALPPWKTANFEITMAYHPNTCGWFFTSARILGSAFVISFIEEFFWRGWLYRWMLNENFLEADLGKFDWKVLLYVALFFGFIHQRWLVGFLCGLVYGLFVIRTRDIWAAGLMHAFTNLLLGVYVVWADQYQFWS